METPKKSKNNKNRRIFCPRRNFWGSKKIMFSKHVPKAIKLQMSFQYHMSQKKRACLFSKPLWCAPESSFDICISIYQIWQTDFFLARLSIKINLQLRFFFVDIFNDFANPSFFEHHMWTLEVGTFWICFH